LLSLLCHFVTAVAPDPMVLLLLYHSASAVRYIETFHKWAGPASNPSSPWHNQQMGMMGTPGMMSNSPGPSSAVFMMDD
jgi:hypothetical protein